MLPTYPVDNRSVSHKIIDAHLICWFEVLNSKQLECARCKDKQATGYVKSQDRDLETEKIYLLLAS